MSWPNGTHTPGCHRCSARLAVLEMVLGPLQNHLRGTRTTGKTHRTLFVYVFACVFVCRGRVLGREGADGAASLQLGNRPMRGSRHGLYQSHG